MLQLSFLKINLKKIVNMLYILCGIHWKVDFFMNAVNNLMHKMGIS